MGKEKSSKESWEGAGRKDLFFNEAYQYCKYFDYLVSKCKTKELFH
jgi:hypothetical protein